MLEAKREDRLARRAGTGNREALRVLYEEYADQLFALAYRLTDCSADARDVLQDVFFELPQTVASFDGRGSLGSWLRSVTTRTALKLLRARERRAEIPIFSEEAASRPPGVLDSIALERAVAALPEGLRTVLILKEIEGYSHKEISGLLEIDPSASATRLSRARAALRAALGER